MPPAGANRETWATRSPSCRTGALGFWTTTQRSSASSSRQRSCRLSKHWRATGGTLTSAGVHVVAGFGWDDALTALRWITCERAFPDPSFGMFATSSSLTTRQRSGHGRRRASSERVDRWVDAEGSDAEVYWVGRRIQWTWTTIQIWSSRDTSKDASNKGFSFSTKRPCVNCLGCSVGLLVGPDRITCWPARPAAATMRR